MTEVLLSGAEALAEPLRGFYAYWNSLPKQGALPRLSDFFDHVPPAYAPYLAIVDVHGPQEARIRLFGTRLVDRAEFDPTGLSVANIYTESLRRKIHDVMWAAVQTPCGYLVHRTIVVRSGFLNEHVSLGLPVEIPTSKVRGVITLTHGVVDARMIDRGTDTLVHELRLDRWIDLGAGGPR